MRGVSVHTTGWTAQSADFNNSMKSHAPLVFAWVLVLIFQQGRLESLLGFSSIGGITSWLPLFLFVILFGLSMDYHVLILSRIKEAHDHGMSTNDSVAHGITATAGRRLSIHRH